MKERYIVVRFDRVGAPSPVRVYKYHEAAVKYARRSPQYQVWTIGYETRKNG